MTRVRRVSDRFEKSKRAPECAIVVLRSLATRFGSTVHRPCGPLSCLPTATVLRRCVMRLGKGLEQVKRWCACRQLELPAGRRKGLILALLAPPHQLSCHGIRIRNTTLCKAEWLVNRPSHL